MHSIFLKYHITSWDMWPHYRKVIKFLVSFIYQDYLLPDPEFDNLNLRQYIKIFTLGWLWKKVICALYSSYLTQALSSKEFEKLQFLCFVMFLQNQGPGFLLNIYYSTRNNRLIQENKMMKKIKKDKKTNKI